MSEAEQREIAQTLFEKTRPEISNAIKLEEEKRAALVKNLYRLRAVRLSRDRNRMPLELSVGKIQSRLLSLVERACAAERRKLLRSG
jgi:hypothetical protein